ncbi:hypothetical protein [Streptomyces platensis]|uniref:hypothetical protein n=1 Tax=Streptomyces platensis TaxID=58346 RepID=UPI001F1A5A99|nr:hypothetical protein [Streptomyces platensis]MCF3146435.1 hypothetical protein [Streptomyces platensis]
MQPGTPAQGRASATGPAAVRAQLARILSLDVDGTALLRTRAQDTDRPGDA